MRMFFQPAMRRRSFWLTIAWCLGAAVTGSGATVTWKSAVNGSWSDGTKWDTGNPPGAGDTAVIDAPGTYAVTLNTPATVAGLSLGGASGKQTLQFSAGTLNLSGAGTVGANGVVNFPNGVIDGAGTLTIQGALSWSGGTMQGVGGKTVLAAGSAVTIAGGNFIQRTIDNSTTVVFTGTAGHFQIGAGAVWNNLAGAVFDVKSDSYVLNAYGGPATLHNAGVVRRSTGTAVTVFDFTLNNSGTVEVTAGQMGFRGGGIAGGAWSAGPGATLQFGGSTFENAGGTVFAGAGRFLVAGAVYRVTSDQSVGAWLELGPGGVIEGAGALTIRGRFDWTGGTMQGAAGKTILASSSATTITAGNLIQRTLDNASTLTFTGAAGHFQIGAGVVWNNLAGSVFDLKADSYVLNAYGGAATFNNSGTVRRSGGTAVTVFDFTLNNSGTVEVSTSQTGFRGGGTAGGTWTAGAGATLQFGGATFENANGTAFTGSGRFLVAGATYKLVANQAVNSWLELGPGGVVDGAGLLTIHGRFDWTGGTMQGAAGKTVLASSSTTTITAGNFIQRTLDNASTATFTGTAGHFQIGASGVWNNLAGSVFDLKADSYVLNAYGGAATFNNSGTVRRSGGTAVTVFDFTLHNSGTVEVSTSQTGFRGGGTAGGTWTAGAGATLQFGGATFENADGTAFTGPGRFLVAGATYKLVANQAVNSWLELGPGGVIDGAGLLTIHGRFDWTGGTMQNSAGKTVLAPSSATTITAGNFIQRTLDNASTATFTGTAGHFQIGASGVWNNLAGSVFDLKADSYVLNAYGGAATFNNSGTVRRSGGTAVTVFDFTLHNSGTVEVSTSQTGFRGGGTAGGTWTAGAGATLQFGGATFENSSGAAFTGAGRFLVAGATYKLINSQVVNSWLELGPGGVIDGSGLLTINGRFDWTGGTMQGGAGKTVLTATSATTITAGSFIQRTLDSSAVVTFTGAAGHFQVGQGAAWNNLPGSVFDMKTDSYVLNAFGGTPSFHNDGVLKRSGGTVPIVFDFQTINGGTVALETGRTAMRGGFTQTNGMTRLAGGHLDGAPLLVDIRGGVLEGAGEIGTGISINGELRPGNPLGKILVTQSWNTTNTAASRSVFQLGGTLAGVDYDQFLAGGAVNLGGELKIEFANGFEPGGADVFEIVRGGVRQGTFSTTNSPPGFSAEVAYSTTNVTLRLLKTGVVGPVIQTQPAAVVVTEGQPATFSVGATGADLTYQWRKNTVNIDGATGASYTINSAKFTDAASYTVVVSNPGGSQVSDPATLTVNPSSIDSALLARYAFEGNLKDAVGAHDGSTNGTLAYVSGARGQALRLNGQSWVTLGPDPTQPLMDASAPFSVSFWIRPRTPVSMVPFHLSSSGGEFALYLSSGLNGDLPTHFGFRGHPYAATTDSRTFINSYLGCWTEVTVVYLGGDKSDPSNFAAYIDGEPIALNTTVNSSVIPGYNEIGRNVGGANGYVVGDLDEVRIYGRALRPEDTVTLSEDPPPCTPEITQDPQSLAVNPGGAAQFAVTAIGATPLSFQWYQGDAALQNATSPTLTINSAQGVNAGVYTVVVTNVYGAVTSAPAALAINTLPPVIVQHPANTAGLPGTTATFSATAVGSNVSYQWRKDGANIDGATQPSLTLNNIAAKDEALYSVEAKNGGGSTFSNSARLWVLPPPDANGLVGYYPFDGNYDDTVNNNDAVPLGASDYFGTGGPRGQYRRVDGFDYMLLGADPYHPVVDTAKPFSVGFWMRHDTLRPVVPVQIAGFPGGISVAFGDDGAGNGQLFDGLTANVQFGPDQIQLGTRDLRAVLRTNIGCWSQVTLVYTGGETKDPGNMQFWLNGERLPLFVNAQYGPNTGVSKIGGSNNALEPVLWGGIDDLRIYNRSVSESEVVALSAGLPQCPPEIVNQVPPTGLAQLGGSLALDVYAIGKPELGYQWYLNNQKIPGATAARYFKASVGVDDGGRYHVVITNRYGQVQSQDSLVTITLPQPPGLSSANVGVPNYISGASFLNAYAGCVSLRAVPGGVGGGVCITANGGQTWTVSNVGVTNDINSIQLIGAVAYIAGSNGLLCISTNSGASWSTFVPFTSANFNCLSFLNPSFGWAAGSGGTICVYNGVQWVATDTSTDADFYSIAYGGTVPWAVGSRGTICRYVGGVWQPWPTGIGAAFYGVAFRNANLGLAVGSAGTICRWNGAAWSVVNSGTTQNIRSVVWADDNTAYIGGDNGLLCISRDGGLTWEPLGTGSNASFGALAISGGRAFLFGAGGTGFTFGVPAQVINQPPQIVINTPTNSQEFYACLRIRVTATAVDPDGSVAKVEFFRGQYKLAEFTSPPKGGRPFATEFHTDAFGEYELRAVATDNLGSVTVSEPVTIEVIPPPEDKVIAEALYDEGMALCFMGDEGVKYRLQGTLDLAPPSAWVNLSTNVMPKLLLRVLDADANQYPYRFYRFERLP